MQNVLFGRLQSSCETRATSSNEFGSKIGQNGSSQVWVAFGIFLSATLTNSRLSLGGDGGIMLSLPAQLEVTREHILIKKNISHHRSLIGTMLQVQHVTVEVQVAVPVHRRQVGVLANCYVIHHTAYGTVAMMTIGAKIIEGPHHGRADAVVAGAANEHRNHAGAPLPNEEKWCRVVRNTVCATHRHRATMAPLHWASVAVIRPSVVFTTMVVALTEVLAVSVGISMSQVMITVIVRTAAGR